MRTAVAALAFLVCLCSGARADTVVVDDFERFSPPGSGTSLRLDEWSVVYDKGKTSISTVTEAGPELPGGSSRVLLISGENNSYDIARRLPFSNISQYPLLRWKWKVTRFPPGADIADPHKDDSAAQVYVDFDLKASYLFYPCLLSICYYYGSTERPGSVFLWEGFGTFVEYVCIRSVPRDGIDAWFTEERNVQEDYRKALRDFLADPDEKMRSGFRRAYEKALGAPMGDPATVPALPVHSISLWVDSNDTRSRAESLYDDITFSTAAAGKPQ